MKTILFDLMASQPVAGSKFHGGGEYIKTVFYELSKRSTDIHLVVFFNPASFIDDWIKNIIYEQNIEAYYVHDYKEVSQLDVFLQADVFFAGLMTSMNYIVFPKTMTVIGVYHGFRSLELPIEKTAPLYENNIVEIIKDIGKLVFIKQYFKAKHIEMKRMIEKCNYIVGVSEHSGFAAQTFFPDYDPSRVRVFYSPEKYIEEVPDIDDVIPKRIILMLGGNRWTKNVYRGIRAVDELFSNSQLDGYSVKIVGGIPRSIQNKIVNTKRFIALGYLTSGDLEKVYKECDVFLYPTLNEGFGYPPIEVMKYGKTCVISAVTSLPEIYKDSVYYCNPYDINEIKMRVLQAVDKKIDKDYIRQHCKRITDRQRKDLTALCDMIIEK